jgi:hypothetical protein
MVLFFSIRGAGRILERFLWVGTVKERWVGLVWKEESHLRQRTQSPLHPALLRCTWQKCSWRCAMWHLDMFTHFEVITTIKLINTLTTEFAFSSLFCAENTSNPPLANFKYTIECDFCTLDLQKLFILHNWSCTLDSRQPLGTDCLLSSLFLYI